MINKLKFIVCLLLFIVKANAQCENNYGTIVISEVYFDTQYNENLGAKYHHFGEYIELYNSSDEYIDLYGWTIADNHTFYKFVAQQNYIIPPGGYKIIIYDGTHRQSFGGLPSAIGGANKFVELFPEAAGHEQDIILQNRIVLDNDVDKVTLLNSNGKIISEMSYSNGSVASTYLNPTPFQFMFGVNTTATAYTVDVTPIIDNQSIDYGIPMNWSIGNIPLIDQQTGDIIYNIDSDGIAHLVTEPKLEYKNAIYLSTNNNGYYSNHTALNYQVATATPFSMPYSIDLKSADPLLLFPAGFNNAFNNIESISYDIKTGFINGQSKTYFDDLGKSTVSLSKDFVTQYVWGSETVYDSFGRPFRQSFPAPSCFDLAKVNFLTSPSSKSFFLDRYYSNNNAIEPYQATATQTYSEVEYDKLNPGNVIRSYGGNQVQTSPGVLEWKTGYTFTVPAAQEMYYLFGYNFFEGIVTSGKEEIQTKFYKTVGIDANGVENVVFTDGEGKTLASARSGASNIADYEVYSLIGTQGFVDVHIPSGTPAATFTTGTAAVNYVVYDLKTGNVIAPTPATLPSGNAYRIALASTVTPPISDPIVYVTNVTTGGVLSTSAGAFGIKYKVNYYDYAINVYDKTNRLSRSIQPNGFMANFAVNPSTFKVLAAPTYLTSANFATVYTYNTLGQVEQVVNKDEGTSKFAYRQDGQIRYSQSQLQGTTKVSYSNYDSYGRPIESGVITGTGIWALAQAAVDSNTMAAGTSKTERTFTIYDYIDNVTTVGTTQIPTPYSMVIPTAQSLATLAPTLVQKNLSGNVAVTYKADGTTINAITWYSYDLYGRLEWVAQYNDGFGNVVKTIDYEYDYKGNVSKVLYQKDNTTEKFIHRYTYDDNGTLTKVETSVDNASFINHAEYTYYKTGELKRLNLLQAQQGLDYVYTLGGMLKSINHPSLEQAKDPGSDSNDLFGITLDYYNGDYIRSGTNIATTTNVAGNNQDFTGNIKASVWANKMKDATNTSNPFAPVSASNTVARQGYLYDYNRNNWLSNATYGNVVAGTNTIASNSNFNEGGLTYDSNGNIKTLQRTNDTSTLEDNLIYNYATAGTNRLTQVKENALPTPSNPTDIEDQAAGNYVYNVIGQMTKNTIENLAYTYNTSGLVTQVSKGTKPIVKFFYNERGQRIKKESYDPTGGGTLQSTTYYVLDLSGNILSNYYKPNLPSPGAITQTELPIYGASRLGIFSKGPERASYEITDHLGNVRAVVFKMFGGAAPSVSSYADYYPFGEKLPNRILNSSPPYKYAFQGQELDTETGMEAFQLRLWDGRIGRWLSPDPMGQFASPYLGMGNNPVGMVDPDGGYTFMGAALRWAASGFEGKMHQSTKLGDWGITKPSNTRVFDPGDGGVGLEFHTDYGDERFNLNSDKFKYVAGAGAGGISLFGTNPDSKGIPHIYAEGNLAITEGMFGGGVKFLGANVGLRGNLGKTPIYQLGFDMDTSRLSDDIFNNTSGIFDTYKVGESVGGGASYGLGVETNFNRHNGNLQSVTTSALVVEMTNEFNHGQYSRTKVGYNFGVDAHLFFGVEAGLKFGVIIPSQKR